MKINQYGLNVPNILVKENDFEYSEQNLNQPKYIVEMMNSVFSLDRKAEEYMYLLALNTKCVPVGVFEISHGTVNSSLCSPREILIRALLVGATGIILIHNHPSGDITPSQSDYTSTEKINAACEIIQVDLVDHIIVGSDKFYSMKQEGVIS